MIYALVGTDTKKRALASSKLDVLGAPSTHIYFEHVALIEPLINQSSLFGEPVVVLLVGIMEKAETKDVLTRLLPAMKVSQTIFIIDEPFADAHKVKALEKVATELYDCREEKSRGVDPFGLCNAFARRDKRQAWIEFMSIRDHESGEAIQGALWWKMKQIWEDTLTGKVTKFTEGECEVFADKIASSVIRAHRGEVNLMVELENIVLSI